MEHFQSLRVGSMSAFGEADKARATLIRRIGADQISEFLQAPEQPIHRLFTHSGALRKNARASPIGTRIPKHCHMRKAESFKARRIEFMNDTPLNGLGWNAQ